MNRIRVRKGLPGCRTAGPASGGGKPRAGNRVETVYWGVAGGACRAWQDMYLGLSVAPTARGCNVANVQSWAA